METLLKNAFEGLKVYGDGWKVVEERNFTPEEAQQVHKAEVVPSNFGASVCFHLVSGGRAYIPVSRDSNLYLGEIIPDLQQHKLLTLERNGEIIKRIE